MLFSTIVKLVRGEEFLTPQYNHMSFPKSIEYNLGKEILYESFIPIDAITFYIGGYQWNESDIKTIANKIIEVKNIIIKNKDSLNDFYNLNSKSSDKKIQSLITFRQKLIKKDKSNIFQNLILKDQVKLKRKFVSSKDSINMEKNYLNMLLRIRESILNGQNIVKKLNEEKIEFYKDFVKISANDQYRIMVELALGGFIIRPSSLLTMIQRLHIPKKEIIVRKWITEFMKIVEQLERKLRHKQLIDQKILIKEFLVGWLYRKNVEYDKIFEKRSEIMDLTLDNFNDYINENKYQEEEIKHMITVIDNINVGTINIICGKNITDQFIKYLLSGNDDDKKLLLNEFQKYKNNL